MTLTHAQWLTRLAETRAIMEKFAVPPAFVGAVRWANGALVLVDKRKYLIEQAAKRRDA